MWWRIEMLLDFSMYKHRGGIQAYNAELASPLTVSASYARSQNAATSQQASAFGGKSSKMATFTSATLSRAATLKNKVLAPTAAAPAIQPGQESLPANRGKPLQLVALNVVSCDVHKLTHLPQLHLLIEQWIGQKLHCVSEWYLLIVGMKLHCVSECYQKATPYQISRPSPASTHARQEGRSD